MDPKQEERATLLLESEALDQALASKDVLTLETLTLPQADTSMTEALSMMRMMAMSRLVVFLVTTALATATVSTMAPMEAPPLKPGG